MLTIDRRIEELAGHWRHWWPGRDVQAAAADVRRRLDEAVAAWGLEDVEPLPGGVVALVCAAGDVVLKVNPIFPGGENIALEARALKRWAPSGAVVPVLDTRDGDFTVLLERLVPGTTLEAERRRPEETLEICGEIARRTAAVDAPRDGFAHLRGERELLARWRAALGGEAGALERLLAADDADTVVHGDLHARNVLRHGDGYRLIDPHAYVADRHSEIQPLLDASAEPASAAVYRRWVGRYAAAAGLDARRAAAWTRVRALTDAVQYPGAAAGLLRLAAALDRRA